MCAVAHPDKPRPAKALHTLEGDGFSKQTIHLPKLQANILSWSEQLAAAICQQAQEQGLEQGGGYVWMTSPWGKAGHMHWQRWA